MSDTVQVPVSLMIFLGGVIVSGLTGMLSICGHLLISIRNSMAQIVTKMAVSDKDVDSRLKVLERHDTANEDERRHAQRFILTQNGGTLNVDPR